MHHNVADTVLSSFSRLRTGARWQSPLGFTVCPLIDDTAVVADAQHPSGAVEGHLSWSELDPPDPRRLRVRNHQRAVAMVEAGSVFEGGMAMRALRRCAVVPGRAEVTVTVEPLGGLWWDAGPLRRGGRLEPVAMALLFQADLAAEPLASSATTELSSLSPADVMLDAAGPGRRTAAGWLLEDDDGIVGGWILDHGAIAGSRPVLAWHEDMCATDAAPLRLLHALQEDIEYGALDAHQVDHGNAGRDLILLPRDVCLADHARVIGIGGRR